MKKAGAKSADSAMEEERERRVVSNLDEKEIQRRVNIAHKMLDVQKELLATHQPTKVCPRALSTGMARPFRGLVIHALDNTPGDNQDQNLFNNYRELQLLPIFSQAIHGPSSQAVLEEAKTHFQEQLLRKAAQREADAAMDEEQKR